MKRTCQYCGRELGFFEKNCPDCGAAYEDCSHCEETDSYQDSRYYRDSSEYGSSYSRPPMHNAPQHQAQRYMNNQYPSGYYNQRSSDETFRKRQKNFTKIACVIVILIVIITIFLSIAVITTKLTGYNKTLNDFFNSFEDNDGEAYLSAQLTSEMLYEMYGYDDEEFEELANLYSSYLTFYSTELSFVYGDDIKISHKITDKEKLDEDFISDYNTVISYITDSTNGLEAEEGYDLELEITIKGDDDKETIDAECQVLKINGKWVITSMEADDYGMFEVYSHIENTYENRLDIVNTCAKEIFKAAEDYASYCLRNGYSIEPGTIIGGETINRGVAIGVSFGDEVKLPQGSVTIEDITNGIDTYISDDKIGVVYCVKFGNTGFPIAVICAEDGGDVFVGAYPNKATDINASLSDAEMD